MKNEFRATLRVSGDGKSFKVYGGDIKQFLSNYPDEKFILHVKRDRTTQQNKFFWVLMSILGDEIGMTKEQAHDCMCFKFLQEEEVNEKTGECFTRIRGTRELSKAEMMKFIDQIIIYCADELHIQLPSPGEAIKLDL